MSMHHNQSQAHITGPFHPTQSARSNFYLATHEFRDLSAKTDHSLLASFGSRLAIIGAPKDEWMSRAQYDLLVQKLPEAKVS